MPSLLPGLDPVGGEYRVVDQPDLRHPVQHGLRRLRRDLPGLQGLFELVSGPGLGGKLSQHDGPGDAFRVGVQLSVRIVRVRAVLVRIVLIDVGAPSAERRISSGRTSDLRGSSGCGRSASNRPGTRALAGAAAAPRSANHSRASSSALDRDVWAAESPATG